MAVMFFAFYMAVFLASLYYFRKHCKMLWSLSCVWAVTIGIMMEVVLILICTLIGE